MFVSTDELENTLASQNLILVDCRSFREYSEGHIPGAVNLDMFTLHWFDSSDEGIQMFNVQTEKIFSFLGVDDSKKVIFYDNVSGMLAARGVWMLLYFSHKQVSMLDGGIQKWKTEQRLVETKLNGFESSVFSGKPNSDLLVGYQYIVDNMDKLTIIDARSAGEYDGSIIRASRSGHIPNSINIDWNQNLENDGTFKKSDLLEKMYQVPKDSEIVTYCQGAYRAANTFVALTKLGYTDVKVYLGSWGEWGNKSDLPIQK